MKITPETFSPESKVWIYASGRNFTPDEAERIRNYSKEFISQWVSHGSPVKGIIEILLNRFIVVVVDDSADRACGSSVDASVRFVKFLDEELKAGLLDRTQVCYRSGNSIHSISLAEIEKQIQAGSIDENTLVFNTLVHTLREFGTSFEIPLRDSWLKKYLVKLNA